VLDLLGDQQRAGQQAGSDDADQQAAALRRHARCGVRRR